MNSLLRRRPVLIIGGLIALLALVGVMVATVLRVQQPKPTIELPRATGPTDCSRVCRNADQPGECVGWCNLYQQGGQCPNLNGVNCGSMCGNYNVCIAKCQEVVAAVAAGTCTAGGGGTGGGGGGGTGGGGGGGQGCNPSSPADVWSCFQKTGNCSGAWACHNGTSGCPAACGGSGGTGAGSAVTVFVKDKANGCKPYAQSGTVRMGGTSSCAACNSSCSDPVCNPNRERPYDPSAGSVTWDKSNVGATYTFFFKEIASHPKCSLTSGSGGSSCTIAVNGQEGDCSQTSGCSTDADCSSGTVCVSGTCKDKSTTHLACVESACAHVDGAGSDLHSCTTVGATCTTSTGPVCPQADKCWGNEGADGKCYDCNGDGVINILDFSCFAAHWLETVSGEKAAACTQ